MLEYRELKIRLSRSGTGYQALAEGPSGNASGHFVPPYSPAELNEFLEELSGQLVTARSKGSEPPETAVVRHFGGVLFDALIDDEIRDLYYGSLRAAQDQGRGLRITISLKDAPDLMRVPWEYLYDEPNFLATSDFTPVVRYLDVSWTRDPIEVVRPLRILGMVSSPTGVVELDVEREIENINRALCRLVAENAVEITWLERATLDELQRCLRGGPYHVFHYIGHGEYDKDREESVLLFEDERGRPDPVSGENLGATLANHPTLRFAALNSCEGSRTAEDDPFAGVATGLLLRQIPAVIAMQFAITDRMASVFSQWFYESLAAGFPVDRALSQARLAIFNRRSGVEWGTPVLFMRVQDGRIFDVPDAPSVAPPPPLQKDETDDRPPPPDDEEDHDDEVLPWWRQRLAAIVAAVLVALLAVAAGAYALKGGTGSTPPVDHWSATASLSGMKKVQGVAPDGADSAFVVGANSGALAVQRFAHGSLSPESVAQGSGTMRTVAVSNGAAVAGGRVVAGEGDYDAGIWRRSGRSWALACGDSVCGDSAPGAAPGEQQVLDISANSGTFVAVGREIPKNGVRHPAVWVSSGGESWKRMSGAELEISDAYMTGVAGKDGSFVAVGNSGQNAAVWITDSGGESWTKIAAKALEARGRRVEPQAVTATSAGFFAVGKEHVEGSQRWKPVAWYSGDGRSWSRASIERAAPGQEMTDVASSGDQLIAVGIDRAHSRAAVWLSENGRSWTPESSASFAGEGQPGMLSEASLANGTLLVGGGDAGSARIWSRSSP
jgi:CHAT domain